MSRLHQLAEQVGAKGLHAAHEAGLPLALSVIVTRHNAHEVPQMRAIADRLGLPMDEYDFDVLSESDTCSCSAGDDNPF